MRTAAEYIEQFEPNQEYTSYYHESNIEQMINKARIDTLVEVCNVVKTYKVGNSGSWYDAAVDKDTILQLIKQIK